jgi:hypothetical protein
MNNFMANSVNSAFSEFNKNIVNLDIDRTKIARASRDWLLDQLTRLPLKVDDFPRLFDGMHIKFGSFARNTKIRPLDDIDLILTFSAESSKYWTGTFGKHYLLTVPENAKYLRKLCGDNGYLNSKKLINKLIYSLREIDQYSSAEIHRNQESATLNLKSYEWIFDIVPAFYTDTRYFLIPDGNGAWKATDPRIDQDRVTEVNNMHKGNILQIIRTLKFWNKRPTMPTIPPYLFENIILDYYEKRTEITEFIDFNIRDFWYYLRNAIYNDINDPKGFQGNLNNISFVDKIKISQKALDSYTIANEAIRLETQNHNIEKSINKWREIFGESFPKYG